MDLCLYCYIQNFSTDSSLGLLQVFHVELLEPTRKFKHNPFHGVNCSNSVNHNRVRMLSYGYYSLLCTCCQDWTCNLQMIPLKNSLTKCRSAKSAGAAEYSISAEGHSTYKCPRYDTKQYDSESPVILELWEMQSIPSLPLLPGPLWPGLVAPDSVISISQIELFNI